jgi:uncharacterized protein YycO
VQTVRIIFTRRRNAFSLLLRTFLWSAWSHVAIVDGDQVVEAVTFHGVRVRPLADLLRDSSRHEFVDVPVADAAAVIAAARGQVGKGYDWFGCLGIAARRNWQSATDWFCSELVAWALGHGGTPLFRAEAWRITPRDLSIRAY